VNIDFEIRIILVAAVVLAALVAGLVWRSRTGHSKKVSNGQQIDLAELGATKNGQPVTAFGERLTFERVLLAVCANGSGL